MPLFVGELTKTVLESGLLTDAGDRNELAGPVPALAIPATLHDSLMARLDHLAPAKNLIQTGAVIGREFSHELLGAVARLPTAELDVSLDRLVASELVFLQGTSACRHLPFQTRAGPGSRLSEPAQEPAVRSARPRC